MDAGDDLRLPHAGRNTTVHVQARGVGDHVHRARGVHHGRGQGHPHHGLRLRRQSRRKGGKRDERFLGVAIDVEAETGEEHARTRGHVPARSPGGHRVEQRRELEQGIVGAHRHRGVAGHAIGGQREAKHALLSDRHGVAALGAHRQHLAAALVEQEVAAHELGALRAYPLGTRAALLLVGHRDQQEIPARRAPALAGQRADGHRLGRRLALHVERPAAPHAAFGERPRPRVVAPSLRLGEDGVHVREQPEHGTLRAAAQAGDQVGPGRIVAHHRHLQARGAQMARQQFLSGPLVAGRVDRVDAQQALQQLGRLLCARRGHRLYSRNRPA